MKKLKPSELRIGNYIRATLAVLDDINTGPSFTERMIRDGKDIDNAKWFEPIPLTKEWLLKFEFYNEIIDGLIFTDYKRIDSSLEILSVGGNTGIWQVAFENHTLQVFIKYVHQLQNLYFALTGEELKLSATVAPTI